MEAPDLWLIETVTAAGQFPMKTSGAPEDAGRISISARARASAGKSRNEATACFTVQRPNRQSARRLAKRIPFRMADSLALSQSFSAATLASVCSSQ
jgi:hypothetical protein